MRYAQQPRQVSVQHLAEILDVLPNVCAFGVQGSKAVSQRSAWGPDFGTTGAGAAAGEDLVWK